jgi:hypothetical protein
MRRGSDPEGFEKTPTLCTSVAAVSGMVAAVLTD